MPRTMMMSLMRPVMNSSPASSMKPRSPVRSHGSSSPSIRAWNADLVGSEPLPGLRIHDGDALADESAAAPHHPMRIILVGGRSELMTLKCVAAHGAYDRTATPWGSRDQQCRFGHAVERIDGARVEAIRTERRGK